VVVANKPVAATDDLTLIVDGTEIAGWEDIEVTLRTEGFPPTFQVTASNGPTDQLPVEAGDPCVVKLGADTVITGYVDRVRDYGDANTHRIEITGRGKTSDLVDCGAEWPSHQMIGGNALIIAQRLAQYYGINVVLANGASPGPDVPSWPLNYGETAADIIQRVARNAALLAYEDSLGNLVLANAGSTQAASGISWGVNVQAWSVERSMDQRYSEYICVGIAADTEGDVQGSDLFSAVFDPNVPRHRLMYLIEEYGAANPEDFTEKRAKWEMARRAGRSNVVLATVDSWRDKAGKLWAPNTLMPVWLPAATTGEKLILSEVTFKRNNETGTTADIVAMPSLAFTPEPIVLQPVSAADVKPVNADAGQGGNQ